MHIVTLCNILDSLKSMVVANHDFLSMCVSFLFSFTQLKQISVFKHFIFYNWKNSNIVWHVQTHFQWLTNKLFHVTVSILDFRSFKVTELSLNEVKTQGEFQVVCLPVNRENLLNISMGILCEGGCEFVITCKWWHTEGRCESLL